MPNFEVFTRRMVPLVKQPAVTIQRRGNISVNRAAYEALGKPEAVELLYDPDEKIVGFRPIPTTKDHAYPMRPQGQKEIGPYLVAGMAFTKYYGIDTTVARRWPAEMQGDILCVDLKQESTIVTSNRSASDDDAE
jgi:hypothetical protein